MTTNNYAPGWLYADNIRFINGELDMPVNKDEIINNLKEYYGIYNLPIIIRVPVGIVMLILGTGIVLPILNTIARVIFENGDFLGLLNRLILILMLPILILASYASLILAFRLLLPQRRRLKSAWEQLISTRNTRIGRITFDQAISVQGSEFSYEFWNPQNKRVTGKYRCKAMPFSFDERGIHLEECITSYPHPKPETVTVWYVNDKIHTLL